MPAFSLGEMTWIALLDNQTGEDARAIVLDSGLKALREESTTSDTASGTLSSEATTATTAAIVIGTTRTLTTRVRYELSGLWHEKITSGSQQYDLLSIPNGGTARTEGHPQIPSDGFYLALPNGVSTVSLRLVDKATTEPMGAWRILPAPNDVTDPELIEGKQRFREDAEIYARNSLLPAVDFEFVEITKTAGIPVAHFVVFPVQYSPARETVTIASHLTIEVQFEVKLELPLVAGRPENLGVFGRLLLDAENVPVRSRAQLRGELIPPARKTGAGAVSYLIILPDNLRSSVTPLEQLYGAAVVTLEQIRGWYPAAPLLESAIRDYLKDVFRTWDHGASCVLLVGDEDRLPLPAVAELRSDHFYTMLEGDANFKPQIVVSRIPCSDPGALNRICTHLAEYENHRSKSSSNWLEKVAYVSGNGTEYAERAYRLQHMSPKNWLTELSLAQTNSGKDQTPLETMVKRLQAGAQLIIYRGHGMPEWWSYKAGLNIGTIASLENESMPPFVFSVCCFNGKIDHSRSSVVEAFLQNRACVAVSGAYEKGRSSSNNDLAEYLVRISAVDQFKGLAVGHALTFAKSQMFADTTGPLTEHKKTAIMMMQFGDPAARILFPNK